MLNRFYQKMRYRAYQKGFRDGHKWAWKNAVAGPIPLKGFYKPPFWFDEWYGAGFDTGAKLETD